MSISYTKADASFSDEDHYHITIDPKTRDQFPFPSDYTFFQCLLPKGYLSFAEQFHNFHVRPDDIWITTFSKAGTTWIMNILWQLKNKLNFSASDVDHRYKYFDKPMLWPLNDDNKNDEDYKQMAENVRRDFEAFNDEESPRLIKSHLPAYLLPKEIWTVKSKLIYAYRNAKDVAISMYHMYKNHTKINYAGTLEHFLDDFLENRIVFGPFYDHVYSYLQLKGLDHILFIQFEDMIGDPFAAVKKISTFLNYSYSDNELTQLAEHLSFQNMRNRNKIDKEIYPNGFK